MPLKLLIASLIGLLLVYTVKYVVDLLHLKVDYMRAVTIVTNVILAISVPALLVLTLFVT